MYFYILKIIAKYAEYFSSPDFSIYAKATIYNNEIRETKNNLVAFPIIHFREYIEIVYENINEVCIPVGNFRVCTRMIITFEHHNGGDFIPMLESGELMFKGTTLSKFTGYSSHIIEKKINGDFVPEEPIYTITLGKYKDGIPDAYLNLKRMDGIKLNLKFKPQNHSVKINICLELHNKMIYDGSGALLQIIN